MQVAVYPEDTILEHITRKRMDLDFLFSDRVEKDGKSSVAPIGGVMVSIEFEEHDDPDQQYVTKKLIGISVDGMAVSGVDEAKRIVREKAKEVDPTDDVKSYVRVTSDIMKSIDQALKANNIPF